MDKKDEIEKAVKLNELGTKQLKKNNYEKAIEFYSKASSLKNNPHEYLIYVNWSAA